MNRIDNVIGKFVLFAIPLVLILLAWGTAGDPDKLSQSEGLTRHLWDTLGWVFMIWIILSFYFVIKMVIKKSFRDFVLGRVAGIKERDEREAILSGEAAKFSFLSTLALLLFFLFLSIFTITVGKHPEGLNKSGKRGYISIGMNFFPFSNDVPEKKVIDKDLEIFTYTGVPLSNSTMLIIIILWQVLSYKAVIRREIME